MDSLKSIQKTAEILDVSSYTIRAWIHQGLLASVKLGTRRLVAESEIQRVIQEGINTQRER